MCFNASYGIGFAVIPADNKHFTLHVNANEYPAKIGTLIAALCVVSGVERRFRRRGEVCRY